MTSRALGLTCFSYADMFEQMNNPFIDGELHLLPFAYFKTMNTEMVSLLLIRRSYRYRYVA